MSLIDLIISIVFSFSLSFICRRSYTTELPELCVSQCKKHKFFYVLIVRNMNAIFVCRTQHSLFIIHSLCYRSTSWVESMCTKKKKNFHVTRAQVSSTHEEIDELHCSWVKFKCTRVRVCKIDAVAIDNLLHFSFRLGRVSVDISVNGTRWCV